MFSWRLCLLGALCLITAVLRVVIPQPGVDLSIASLYKDAAHLLVGGIFGAAVLATSARSFVTSAKLQQVSLRLWIFAVALTLVEVFMAGVSLRRAWQAHDLPAQVNVGIKQTPDQHRWLGRDPAPALRTEFFWTTRDPEMPHANRDCPHEPPPSGMWQLGIPGIDSPIQHLGP